MIILRLQYGPLGSQRRGKASLDVDEIGQSGRLGLDKNLGQPRHNSINVKAEKCSNNPPMTRIFFFSKRATSNIFECQFMFLYVRIDYDSRKTSRQKAS